jgi:hypothetical protein
MPCRAGSASRCWLGHHTPCPPEGTALHNTGGRGYCTQPAEVLRAHLVPPRDDVAQVHRGGGGTARSLPRYCARTWYLPAMTSPRYSGSSRAGSKPVAPLRWTTLSGSTSNCLQGEGGGGGGGKEEAVDIVGGKAVAAVLDLRRSRLGRAAGRQGGRAQLARRPERRGGRKGRGRRAARPAAGAPRPAAHAVRPQPRGQATPRMLTCRIRWGRSRWLTPGPHPTAAHRPREETAACPGPWECPGATARSARRSCAAVAGRRRAGGVAPRRCPWVGGTRRHRPQPRSAVKPRAS